MIKGESENNIHKNNRYFYDHMLFSDSPLIIACQYGNPEIVSLLCGSGFLINVVDRVVHSGPHHHHLIEINSFPP
jgi:hypothetical protein